MASPQQNNMKSIAFLLGALLALQFAVTCCSAQWALFGVFDPDRGFDQDRVRAMDDWEKKQSSVQLVFTTFDPQEQGWLWNGLVNIWSSKKIPIISWEPWFLQAQVSCLLETSLVMKLTLFSSPRREHLAISKFLLQTETTTTTLGTGLLSSRSSSLATTEF